MEDGEPHLLRGRQGVLDQPEGDVVLAVNGRPPVRRHQPYVPQHRLLRLQSQPLRCAGLGREALRRKEYDIRAITRPLHHLEELDLQVHADRQSQDMPVDHRPHAVPTADEPLALEPGQGVPELRAADVQVLGQVVFAGQALRAAESPLPHLVQKPRLKCGLKFTPTLPGHPIPSFSKR